MSCKMDKEISELLLKNAFEEYENARCDEIIEKYKDTEPEYSEEHKRRMEKLFKKEKKSFCWSKFVKRAAMIILAVFLSGTLALQVEALKIKFYNWYYEVTGKSIEINLNEKSEPNYNSYVYRISDDILNKYNLFIETSINEKYVYTKYTDENKHYIELLQHSIDSEWSIDYEDGEVMHYKIRGNDAIIAIKEDRVTIWWSEEPYVFCLVTNYKKDIAIEIAEKLVIKQLA